MIWYQNVKLQLIYLTSWWSHSLVVKKSLATYPYLSEISFSQLHVVITQQLQIFCHTTTKDCYKNSFFIRTINRDVSFPSFAGISCFHEVQIPTLILIFSLFWRLLAQIPTLFFRLFRFFPSGQLTSLNKGLELPTWWFSNIISRYLLQATLKFNPAVHPSDRSTPRGCVGAGGTQIWVEQGCAARASKPIPIFKGDFGQKGYPVLRIFLQK